MKPGFLARCFRSFSILPHFKGKSWIEYFLEPHVPLPPQSEGIDFPCGMKMEIDPRSGLERGFYYHNHEGDTFDLIHRTLQSGMVFADCGANIGFYTLVASRLVGNMGHVYAFEPTSLTFERLSRHILINDCSNVTAFRLALGERPETAHVFQFSSDNHGMNIVASGNEEGQNVGECEISSMDALISRGAMRKPDLMKIDVEGSEFGLLRGAELLLLGEPTPTLIIELSRYTMRRFGYEPEDVIAYLFSLRDYVIEWPFLGKIHRVSPGQVLPHYAVLGADHGANYVFRPSTGLERERARYI